MGKKRIIAETGAGQHGVATATICALLGLKCEVYMVKLSYEHKPYRKTMMNTWGAKVFPSPSNATEIGKKILSENPNTTGSLGIAISEAIERAASNENTKYALGSVLNHVKLHQTIVGQEAVKQMEKAGDLPDIVIAPFGGGSNFAGLSFPFLRLNFEKGDYPIHKSWKIAFKENLKFPSNHLSIGYYIKKKLKEKFYILIFFFNRFI